MRVMATRIGENRSARLILLPKLHAAYCGSITSNVLEHAAENAAMRRICILSFTKTSRSMRDVPSLYSRTIPTIGLENVGVRGDMLLKRRVVLFCV